MFNDQPAIGVSLASLFSRCRFHYTKDIRVTSCCTDAELCKDGDLYVALMHDHGDGHTQAELAVERGAVAVLAERLLPVEVPQCLVPNSNAALAQLCQRLAGDPGAEVSVVGVAGNAGKTSTQMLLTSVLCAAGHQPALFGNLGTTDGLQAFPVVEQQASSSVFARWLANAASKGCTHAVTELQRDFVLRHIFGGVLLKSLVLTSLSTSTHRKAATPKTKAYVERLLKQLVPGGLVVANIDCPIVEQMVGEISNPVLTVSMEREADLTARRLEQFPSEQTFLLEAGEQTSVVRTKIIGDSHLLSCLMAVAAGLGSGIDLATSVGAVESIAKIPGRLERVECGQPFSIFSDAATSSQHLRQTLVTLREVTEGKLICVFGQGESPRQELRSLRGSIVERYADLGIITSDMPDNLEPLRATHDVLDGYRKPAKAHVMPNRTRAIEWALQCAEPGDTVVLAGPHNRRMVREDNDFPADADVARFVLFSQDKDLTQLTKAAKHSVEPSWN